MSPLFKLSTRDKRTWLAYKLTNSQNQLVVRDLTSSRKQYYLFVTDYEFNESGEVLLLKTAGGGDGSEKC